MDTNQNHALEVGRRLLPDRRVRSPRRRQQQQHRVGPVLRAHRAPLLSCAAAARPSGPHVAAAMHPR